MERLTSPLAVGNSYFWKRHCRSLLKLTVVALDPTEIAFSVEVLSHHSSDIGLPLAVTWTPKEWEEAQNSIRDYWPPVKSEDLAADEELCRICSGHGLETDKDEEISFCFWCGTKGKVKKTSEESKPEKKSRSRLHPKVSVDS